MTRKFVIEFTVEDSDIKSWQEAEARELEGIEDIQPEVVTFTGVDLIASQWATGEGLPSLTVTRNEEVTDGANSPA